MFASNPKILLTKNTTMHFLSADQLTVKKLFEHIYIVDGASNILDVEKIVKKQIRYSCIPKYENLIYERLEGWWYKKGN